MTAKRMPQSGAQVGVERGKKPAWEVKIHLEAPDGGSLCRRARGFPHFTTVVAEVTCATCASVLADFIKNGAP